jgi:hypothetical protein
MAASIRHSVRGRHTQRGMVVAVTLLFLIATVVFVLSKMLDTSSNNVIDGQRQGESTAAFFLAESGLEHTQAAIAAALGDSFSNTTCTGLGSSFNLGRGTVAITTTSVPASCNNGGGTPCTGCSISSKGTVSAAQRTVAREVALAVENGVFCNGSNGCGNSPVTWKLNLKNTAAVAGIGVFALSYDEHGNNRASCAVASNCRLQLDLTSPASGQNSVGMQGNAVLIPASTTYPIYQTMTKGGNSLAEVGGFFLGTTAPTLTGPTANPGAAAYWEIRNNNGTLTSRTVGAAGDSTGGTNDGVATSTGTCDAPSANTQTCTSWCYGGDTLAYIFSANVNGLSDQINAVTFGTNAGVGQNVALTRIAKYPSTTVSGAPTNVDAEIWYARNANLTPATTPLGLSASSYKGKGTATIGASWSSTSASQTAIASDVLTVAVAVSGIISVGDTVTQSASANATCTTSPTCGTIVSQLTSTEAGGVLGGRGTYRLSGVQTVNGTTNRIWTINSNVLRVTACTICFFGNGDALSSLVSGRAINGVQSTLNNGYGLTESTGGIGRYPIGGTPTRVASGTVYAGTPGTTLYLPAASSQPTVTTPPMLIRVRTGTGVLAPGTTVTAVDSAPTGATNTTAFTVSTAPTTALDGASVCGGTCALFVPGADTTFALTFSTPANFNGWASGFMCMKGVDITPAAVTSSSTTGRRWTEVVQ